MNTTYPPTSMELSIPSELGYEMVARDAVAAYARRQGFAGERIEDLKTALCEACINAIEHGNSMTPGLRVDVSCHSDEHQLLIEISDQGVKRYAPTGDALSIGDKVAGRGPLRGMGLMLIAQLTDEAGFVDGSQRGNCFRLTFYR